MNNLRRYGTLFILILIIPIFNVVSSLATPFFPGTFNPGVIRGIVLTLFLFWYMFKIYRIHSITTPTIIFVLYLFVLCWFSSELMTSLYIYNKVIITSLLFIVSFQTFNTIEKLNLLFRVIVITLLLQELYFLFSNLTGIGKGSYMDDSVLFGETGVNMTKAMVVFILTIPTFLRIETNRRWQLFATIFLLIGILIVILGMKRSAILAMMFGFLTYVVFTPFKSRVIQFLPIALVIIISTSPFYFPIIEKRFQSRQERVSMTYNQLQESESEGRMLEVKFTVEDALEEGAARLFFGFDLFLKKDFNGHKRMLHVDYMNMLGGAGLVGLGLFLYLYYKIGWFIWLVRQKVKQNNLINELSAMGFSLIAVQAFLSIGGTMQGVNLRGYILFILGAIVSILLLLLKNQFASDGNK
ncbi:MAG: hypothetical protein FJZ67_11695 [Bacteroidetes bacterium]|nr:hypothetical protein [Bacteroidota bacterium]